MKTIKYILSAIIAMSSLWACSDDWDAHYKEKGQLVNNAQVTVVQSSLQEYLKAEPSLTSMYTLFVESGTLEAMNKRDQLFTVLVVGNNNMGTPSTDDKEYLAKSHISDIALSPANLPDGQRVLMWHGKYLNVTVEEGEDKLTTLYFNGTKVTKIIKVNDGYVYELESYVNSPKSMYEVIESLSDEYSMFRDSVMAKNERTFDKANSIPIGVDNTGSTVYDSVFITTNPYFEAVNFNLMSESLNATMLIPSNEVMEKALAPLNDYYANGLYSTKADTLRVRNWLIQAMFYNQKYTKQDFADNEYLASAFGKKWKTTVQTVDLDNPITMSNGVAYYVETMKIPTNVVVYRIKDYMRWYEHLSDGDKAKYFASENLTYNKMTTAVTAWSGWPGGGFPNIENRIVEYNLTDKTKEEFKMDFTTFRYKSNINNTYTVAPYKIPPGEYELFLGFKQNLGHDVEVSFNGELVRNLTTSELTSTSFHYDRSGNGFPEGYDTKYATDKNKGKYDCDGGKVGVVTVTGTEFVEAKIFFHGKLVSVGKTVFHHWCLRPTENCY